jgi:ribonuclease VapC
MKNQVVLDTSAILALLAMEEGHEVVAENLENAVVSSVTFFEVLEILISKGLDYKEAAQSLKDTFPNIEQFNAEQVIIASAPDNSKLSFGDRACLALAKSRNLPVLTADKVWKELDLGVEVQLIR